MINQSYSLIDNLDKSDFFNNDLCYKGLSINKLNISRLLLSILLMFYAQTCVAHTYFFGVSEINVNKNTQHIEVIHQFTAHDIDNAIAEIQQVNFSTEHPKYDAWIQAYIEKHFTLINKNQEITMHWVGFEIIRGQLYAYQESLNKHNLANLTVKNTILIDTFNKQINTVNYQDVTSNRKYEGSLTFNQSIRVAIITTEE